MLFEDENLVRGNVHDAFFVRLTLSFLQTSTLRVKNCDLCATLLYARYHCALFPQMTYIPFSQQRSRLPYLERWLKEKIESEYNINIDVAFKLLGNVGELLRISYAGCKGYSCQVAVAKVHSRYQNMIYDSARVRWIFPYWISLTGEVGVNNSTF